MNKGDLISIREAARLLGVSEAALRLWTGESRIKAFITPGGHRRYSRAELKKFIESDQKTPGIKDLAVVLEGTISAHREMDIAYMHSTVLKTRPGQEVQQGFSKLGRTLLSLIIKYLSLPAERPETLDSIRSIGGKFGEMTAALGFPLIDSVQTFIRHRDPIVSATTEFMRTSEHLSRRISQSIPLIDKAMDEALVALVGSHQDYLSRMLKEAKGEDIK